MVVAVEVPDSPGGLDSVLQLVSANGINLEYMYAFVRGEQDKAVMIFRFDKIEQAIELLTKNGFSYHSWRQKLLRNVKNH